MKESKANVKPLSKIVCMRVVVLPVPRKEERMNLALNQIIKTNIVITRVLNQLLVYLQCRNTVYKVT